MTDNVKKLVLLNLPYLIFVYLFDKLCQGVRLAPGADASEKLLHIGQGFSAAFASLAPSFHLVDLCVGAAGAMLIRLVVYGRDIALEESGQFTDLGYVRDTGDSFHEYYDGERGSIPEEYRVMTFQDDVPEEEVSEWAMDLAYDMDEFFRQHDPQYAAEHPEEHAAKEEIYENLMAGRISALDEKLAALGQTQEDYCHILRRSCATIWKTLKPIMMKSRYAVARPAAIRKALFKFVTGRW